MLAASTPNKQRSMASRARGRWWTQGIDHVDMAAADRGYREWLEKVWKIELEGANEVLLFRRGGQEVEDPLLWTERERVGDSDVGEKWVSGIHSARYDAQV